MTALGFMPLRYSLHCSLVPNFLSFLFLLLLWKSIELFKLSLHALSLFDAMIQLALDLRNATSLNLLIEDQTALFTHFFQPVLCLFGVKQLELLLLCTHKLLLRADVELC